ncbi:hypothetical protein KC333_g1080 [Hortaea werneckii]|nr:hypothetical protein KC333_g1080 [Hortaea werneckii]KAI7323130.1 hypothetical protein KC326_g1672 [Hortaea werneckii]
MAEVAMAGHHRSSNSIDNMGSLAMATGGAPRIEMKQNLDFSFPRIPQGDESSLSMPRASPSVTRRPMSMHSSLAPPPTTSIAHRRAKSGAPLPTFSFNSADSTGLKENVTPPVTPGLSTEPAEPSPKRHGHRRESSQLVGGHGMQNAISSSPTKTDSLPLPETLPKPPAGGRRHRHGRSQAMSSSDLSSIMNPKEPEPRLSSSLPTTPLDHPSQLPPPPERTTASDTSVPTLQTTEPQSEDSDDRPPSRRMVGFSETVQYIPRPLSTISSETERSTSPARGHSVNNSISSMLSLSAPSPPNSRARSPALSTTLEDETKLRPRSSLEISKRIEKEGEWLRSASPHQSMRRPVSTSAAGPGLSSDAPSSSGPSVHFSDDHSKKYTLSHALGLDRRKSEPVISLQPADQARLSAISLREESDEKSAEEPAERRRSNRLKEWAASKLGRRSKDLRRKSAEDVSNAEPSPSTREVPGKVPLPKPAPAAAETDLDAVFSSEMDSGEDLQRSGTPPQPRIDVSSPSSFGGTFQPANPDDSSMLDLDAALGPFKTPESSSKRRLHSSRLNKDFTGPGMHYHRRTESAPALAPTGFSRPTLTSTDALPDVFEGEGEEEAAKAEEESSHATSPCLEPVDEGGVGIQVVDADSQSSSGNAFDWGAEEGLGIQRDEWNLERPNTSCGSVSSRLSAPNTEHRRASSIVEETIPEELSPVGEVQVVEAHEEPRASSVTKSSDSSDTPTILAPHPPSALPVPDSAQSTMTPETYQTSTFSSPDLSRHQCSFDTSRLGTSASSIADNRTTSSCAGGDVVHRISVDDVPSLTSSRSTMLSTMHANVSKRDFGSGERMPPMPSETLDPATADDRRRKRASIQSLSQLVGGSFQGKSKAVDESRPHTAVEPITSKQPRKEHRLKKLMFWRSKSRQSLQSNS